MSRNKPYTLHLDGGCHFLRLNLAVLLLLVCVYPDIYIRINQTIVFIIIYEIIFYSCRIGGYFLKNQWRYKLCMKIMSDT